VLEDASTEGATKANAARALGVFALLTAPTDANRDAVAAAGTVPPLVELLSSCSGEAVANARGALENIACDAANRAAIVCRLSCRLLCRLVVFSVVLSVSLYKGFSVG
jgi:hypothetical protein